MDNRHKIIYRSFIHCITKFHFDFSGIWKVHSDGWHKLTEIECEKCGKIFK